MTDAIQMAGWVWRGSIVWGTNGRKEVDWKAAKAMPGIYHINTKQKHHQTEKPVELLKALIQICPRGGTVVDCFMGSGSTGVACVQEGRNFIGVELILRHGHQAHPGGRGRTTERLLESRRTLQTRTCYTGKVDE